MWWRGKGIFSLDITNEKEVLDFVRREQPDVIINCAAHTNVDACEKQWDLAYKINALGPRNLSIAATETDAKLVHVSTDYVFSGDGTRPYTEFDEPNPVSAYGKTKLEGEKFVQQFAKKFFILRTAWLYGDGKNFVKTMLRLAKTHDEVTVVEDQLGSPTSASELAKMIHFLEPTGKLRTVSRYLRGGYQLGGFHGGYFWEDGAFHEGSPRIQRGVCPDESGHCPPAGVFHSGKLYAEADGAGIFHGSLGGRHRRVSEGYPPGGYPVDYRRERKEERWTSRW